jgi:hypothetical protein
MKSRGARGSPRWMEKRMAKQVRCCRGGKKPRLPLEHGHLASEDKTKAHGLKGSVLTVYAHSVISMEKTLAEQIPRKLMVANKSVDERMETSPSWKEGASDRAELCCPQDRGRRGSRRTTIILVRNLLSLLRRMIDLSCEAVGTPGTLGSSLTTP